MKILLCTVDFRHVWNHVKDMMVQTNKYKPNNHIVHRWLYLEYKRIRHEVISNGYNIEKCTLPEIHIATENRPSQKETIVFQPSIFRCENASFREGSFHLDFSTHSCLIFSRSQANFIFWSNKHPSGVVLFLMLGYIPNSSKTTSILYRPWPSKPCIPSYHLLRGTKVVVGSGKTEAKRVLAVASFEDSMAISGHNKSIHKEGWIWILYKYWTNTQEL